MSNENNNLEKDILNTITYFDIFNFPLTSFEIWKNLYSKTSSSLIDVLYVLDNSELLKSKLDKKESFYFLKNREDIIDKRKNNYIISYNKYKKGIKFIKLISHFSCFKAIFVSNNLSIDNSKHESDIDLFIVSRKNRIWTSRFISAFLAKILFLRPTEKTKKNKICLSIFLDKQDLNLKKVCSKKDAHFLYWINQVVPIFDPSNVYSNFVKANNWIKEDLSNVFEYKTGYKRVLQNNIKLKIFRKFSNIFSNNYFENFFKNIETKIFPDSIKQKILNKNSEDVFVDDSIIKLHDNDNRKIYNELFLQRIK